MRLVVHPAAQSELDAALTWSTAEFGPGVAARLLRQFERAGQTLLGHPTIGTATAARARKLPTSRFPYTLVYRAEGEVIHVIALMHQSRKPGYWQGRRNVSMTLLHPAS